MTTASESRYKLMALLPVAGLVLVVVGGGTAGYVNSRLQSQGICKMGPGRLDELSAYGIYFAGGLLAASVLARLAILFLATEPHQRRDVLITNFLMDATIYSLFAGILYVGASYFLFLILTHVVLAAIFALFLGFSAHTFHANTALHRLASGLDGFLIMTGAGFIGLGFLVTCGL